MTFTVVFTIFLNTYTYLCTFYITMYPLNLNKRMLYVILYNIYTYGLFGTMIALSL